jgi:pimeloyl-ACP methyl ester carboxylesterase
MGKAHRTQSMKKHITYQNGKIYIQTQGRSKSRVLVLLHGFCEDLSIWSHLLPDLAEIRVVCIDLPGFGKSTPLHGNAVLRNYTDAVLHVLDALKLEKVVLVGHSLGGYVALQFADLHPERLAGFGLINSHPLADTPERRTIRTRTVGLIENGGQRAFVKQLFSGLFEPQFAKQHPNLVKGLINKAAKFPPEGIINASIAMRDRPDQTQVLVQTQVPVLLLLGEKDQLIAPEIVDQFMHLPQRSQVQIIKEVAHMAMLEQSVPTTLALSSFISFCTKKA